MEIDDDAVTDDDGWYEQKLKNDIYTVSIKVVVDAYNGDTRYYGLVSTVSCVSCGNTLNLCWSQATDSTRWMDACLQVLREDGVPAMKTE